jgi:hypothetical protein
MSRTSSAFAAAISAGLLLAGCGGGGSSSPAPHAVVTTTAALPASARTVVGTAKLTLALPSYKHAATTSRVIRASSTKRNAKFIDPAPNPMPTVGTNDYPILDIYVDGTLIPNIDNTVGQYHSLFVSSPNADGTVPITLPLYSLDNNTIVAVEYDYNDSTTMISSDTSSQILALGESHLGNFNNGFQAGQAQTVNLVMTENVTGIGMVDEPNEYNAYEMSPNYGSPTQDGNFCGNGRVGFYPTDSLNNFLTTTGTPSGTLVTLDPGNSQSYNNGTTKLAGTSFADIFQLIYDSNYDAYFAATYVQNPASNIYSDITYNATGYESGYVHGTIYSTNQGIYNLTAHGPLSTSLFSNYYVYAYGELYAGDC